ncbi:MAG: hypothetical protein OHK0046_43950 [Anaerolineae bacterium]
MRRTLLIALCILFLSIPAAAQEATPEPNILSTLEALVEQVQDTEARSLEALDDAERAYDTAFNVVGFFEMVSAAVGLIVPFLAIVGALIGFRRLESAQSELREARERFEKDVKVKEQELDELRDALQASAEMQRADGAKASLALALLPLGERQYRAQDYIGALDTYHRALKLDPNNPIVHYRIGYVNTQSGELSAAQSYLQRALELDPDFTPSRAALGYVLRRIADKMPAGVERDLTYNMAEENFLRALKESPKLIDEDNESWWGALGGLYRRRGQIDLAIGAYRRGTEVTPHSSYPFSNLALLYLQTGKLPEARKAYERVEKLAWGEVRAEADNYWAYADLIVSRLALGKYAEVQDILPTALDTAPPESAYTLDSLVETLERLGDVLPAGERPHIDDVVAQIRSFKVKRDTGVIPPVENKEVVAD